MQHLSPVLCVASGEVRSGSGGGSAQLDALSGLQGLLLGRQQLKDQLSAGMRWSFGEPEISGKASVTQSRLSFEDAQSFRFFLFD